MPTGGGGEGGDLGGHKFREKSSAYPSPLTVNRAAHGELNGNDDVGGNR